MSVYEYTKLLFVILLTFLELSAAGTNIWEFGKDSEDSTIVYHTQGKMGLFKKTVEVPIIVPPCMKVMYTRVDVHGRFSNPTVTFNEHTNVVRIQYNILSISTSSYEVLAKAVPSCTNLPSTSTKPDNKTDYPERIDPPPAYYPQPYYSPPYYLQPVLPQLDYPSPYYPQPIYPDPRYPENNYPQPNCPYRPQQDSSKPCDVQIFNMPAKLTGTHKSKPVLSKSVHKNRAERKLHIF